MLLCFSLSGQDCGKIDTALDLLNIKSDSLALSEVSNWPDLSERRCWLQKRSDQHFKNYEYKKALLFATTLEDSYQQNTISDSSLIFKNWEILSNSYYEMGLPDSTILYGKKLLWAMDQRIPILPEALPRILEIVAMSFADKLQYDLALEWIDLFIYHMLEEGLTNRETYFEVLYVKGVIVTRQVKLEKADSLMSVILSNIKEAKMSNSNVEFRVLTLQIRLKLFLGELNDSKERIKQCKDFLKYGGSADNSTYISFLMNQSYYYLIIGDINKSDLLTSKCLELSKDLNEYPVLYPKVKMFAAINMIEAGDVDGSISFIRDAISYLESGIFFEMSNVNLRNTLFEAISGFLNARYDNKGFKSDLDEAWEIRKKIHALYLKNRAHGQNLLSNVEIPIEDIKDLKNSYEFQFKLNSLEFNNDLFVQGLKLSDQIKSDLLNNNFFKANIRNQNKEFKKLFEKDDSNKELIVKQIQNINYNNIQNYRSFRELIIAREAQNKHYGRIQKILENDNDLESINDDYDLKSLKQRLIKDSTTILNYFFNGSDLYISLISPFKNYSLRIDSDSLNLDSIVLEFVKITSTNPLTSNNKSSFPLGMWEKRALQLYEVLISPFVGDIYGNLLIIPDGVLHYLPFSSLIEEIPIEIESYRQYSFLVKKYGIFYSNSVESYLYQSQSNNGKKKLEFLGVAPTFSNDTDITDIRNDLGRLNYNVAEIEEIENIVGGTTLIGRDSELSKIKEHITDVSIVHMATHTLMPFGRNGKIEIVLNDRERNKYYTAIVSEILKESRSPNLVVLSACNSAIGEHKQGEGLVSLTNGFFKKGANSVISTLWEANDFSMNEIFVKFYENINNEIPIVQSLRLAQINYLNNSTNEILHPYFWSGVSSYGAGDLKFEKNSRLNLLGISIVIGIALLLILLIGFKYL